MAGSKGRKDWSPTLWGPEEKGLGVQTPESEGEEVWGPRLLSSGGRGI